MASSSREDFVLQFTDLLATRVSDEQIFKFIKSLYKLYNSSPQDRFTLDNLTDQEKLDIDLYASTAIINVIRRLRSRRDLTFFKNINDDREFLSGLVFLRLEFIPICYQLNENNWYPMRKWIEKIIDVEAVLKRVIREKYEKGCYQGIKEEGPNGHYWWTDGKIGDEERFSQIHWNNINQLEHEIRDEYNLTD